MVIFLIATVIFIHVACVAHQRRGEQRKKRKEKKVKRFIIYNIANATKVIRISLGPGVMRCGAFFLLFFFFFFIPDRVSLLFPSLNAIFLCCAPQQIHSMNINRTKSFCIDSVAMLNRCHLFKYTGLVIVIAFFFMLFCLLRFSTTAPVRCFSTLKCVVFGLFVFAGHFSFCRSFHV